MVAADGSRSFVRRKLKWDSEARLARLLEVLTPEAVSQQAFTDGVAVFDFTPISTGVQGYYWDFPSLVNQQAMMNRGVFDSRIRSDYPRPSLKQTLATSMRNRDRNLSDFPLKGHPIHWFSPSAQFARPRILLAGDAAGVDPFLGEGIAFALAYGQVVAEAIENAFSQHNFSFQDYRRRVLAHPFLSQLSKRTRIARFIYSIKSPWQRRLVWKCVCLLADLFIWTLPITSVSKAGHLQKSYRRK